MIFVLRFLLKKQKFSENRKFSKFRELTFLKSRMCLPLTILIFFLGVITNIPSGMVTDQFGMIGLLTFIRAAETEPNLVTLALGRLVTFFIHSLFYSLKA